tara:strand:+ start:3022 stop:3234 length:213 start_codon:yes stop_codon:yes gene_type:complete
MARPLMTKSLQSTILTGTTKRPLEMKESTVFLLRKLLAAFMILMPSYFPPIARVESFVTPFKEQVPKDGL